ncbi:hypothetical protein BMS3Abin03_00612 [bacterium BMS3Abin03]|nr:hypothetical protein BMS3Abin03_00612 [bacterium BMS3Abin03]
MMKKNKLSTVYILIIFIVLFISSCLLIKYTNINIKVISDNPFLFTYLGIFLGFALTIFTFIVSMVDKIKEAIENDRSKTREQKEDTESNILSFYSEIKDDIFLIFYFFVIVTILSLFENIDIPLIKLDQFFLSKTQLIDSIKLGMFILSLYAIYDLTSSAFKISEATGIFKKEDKAS